MRKENAEKIIASDEFSIKSSIKCRNYKYFLSATLSLSVQ
ncbi:hypothetical protein HMPREF3218_0201207 [Prevotella bivia]|nr:hypothetical protein HMPREF3218_0201207 [Prevotella bivia]